MARIYHVLAIALAIAAATVSASCDTVPAATTTWDVKCNNATSLGPHTCWSHGAPDATSTVLFPAGTNVTIGTWHGHNSALPYVIFRAANVVIEEGAMVNMTGDGMQIDGCLMVKGALNLVSSSYWGSNWTQAPIGEYPADPSQPLGTDCKLVPVGFTPRVCGPGKIDITGTVSVSGLYASLFIGGTVQKSGALTFKDAGFFWGNLSNKGNYTTKGYTYQHGFLFNEGRAVLDSVWFDKWATSFVSNADTPLLLENRGTMIIGGEAQYPTQANYSASDPDGYFKTYRAAIVNYADVSLTGWLAPLGFDMYNMGTATWGGYWGEYEGDGVYHNRGTMVADGVAVSFGTLYNDGGQLVTKNYGSFTYNNGAANIATRATMRLCSLVQGMPSKLQERFRVNAEKRKKKMRHHRGPGAMVVRGEDGCNWYCGTCYTEPYGDGEPLPMFEQPMDDFVPAVDPTGLPLHRHGGEVRLHIQRALADDVVPVDPCNAGRYRFINTTVSGDGTGSIVSTVPIQIGGTVQLKNGAKWHMAMERGQAPVFGGGKVVVGKGAAVYVGIEAEFMYDGKLEVARGGLLAVPRHGRVAFSNHTVNMRPGSKLHVDGAVAFAERKGAQLAVDNCALVDGIGSVTVDREGGLACSSEPQTQQHHKGGQKKEAHETMRHRRHPEPRH